MFVGGVKAETTDDTIRGNDSFQTQRWLLASLGQGSTDTNFYIQHTFPNMVK